MKSENTKKNTQNKSNNELPKYISIYLVISTRLIFKI